MEDAACIFIPLLSFVIAIMCYDLGVGCRVGSSVTRRQSVEACTPATHGGQQRRRRGTQAYPFMSVERGGSKVLRTLRPDQTRMGDEEGSDTLRHVTQAVVRDEDYSEALRWPMAFYPWGFIQFYSWGYSWGVPQHLRGRRVRVV